MTSLRPCLLFGALIGCAAPGTVSSDGDAATPFSPDECKASLDAKATLTVGAGQTTYADIEDGTVLTWEKGPQGGHHVWLAVSQRGLRRRGSILTVDLEDVEDASAPKLVNHSRVVYDFSAPAAAGGSCTLTGLRMQLDNAGGVTLAELLGHHVRVTAVLRDTDGAQAMGARTIVVRGAFD